MRPSGKRRDRERWGNTESGARKCHETEQKRGHPWRGRERDPWRVEGREGDIRRTLEDRAFRREKTRVKAPRWELGACTCVCQGRVEACPAVWLYSRLDLQACPRRRCFLPRPTWALACSPSLGDGFSNKLEPRGGSTLPSQPWPAASSKHFSWPWG